MNAQETIAENKKQGNHKATKQLSEMSDREVQESIAANLRIVTRNSKSINGWMTFIGIVMILNIIGAIYIVSQM